MDRPSTAHAPTVPSAHERVHKDAYRDSDSSNVEVEANVEAHTDEQPTPSPVAAASLAGRDERWNRDFEVPIVYYDAASLLVVNKPWNLRIDGPVTETSTLEAILKASTYGERHPKLFLLHQLDYATSGVHMWGLSKHTARIVGKMFMRKQIHKTYLAIVAGHVCQDDEFEITKPLAPVPDKDGFMFVPPDGHPIQGIKDAHTIARVVRRGVLAGTQTPVTLMKLLPQTGRQHQLRVHMASLGHPIIGDIKYELPEPTIADPPRMMLHSWQTRLQWPDGRHFLFVAPDPLAALVV